MLEPLLGTNTFDQDRTKQYCFTLSGDSMDNASKNLSGRYRLHSEARPALPLD